MKTNAILLLLCLVLATTVLRTRCALGDTKSEDSKRAWTILVYGAVDNSADDAFVEFTDQVRQAIDDDSGIELLVFIDRSTRHRKRVTFFGDDFTSSRLYRVRKDSVERLSGGSHFPELTKEAEVNLNSADASTLQRFITWGKSTSPAERYALLIYSHADGKSMCPDDQSRSQMGVAELTDKIDANQRVDFLALELCNMGGIEIAYQWRPGNGGFEADVLLAIPNAGPPLDWDRAFRRIRSSGHDSTTGPTLDPATMTAEDFGKLVIEEGHLGRQASETAGQQGSKESAGCYDLRKAADVKKAVDALAVALANSESKDTFLALRNAGSKERPIAYADDGSYVDLYDLCRRAAACEDLSEGVRSAATEVMNRADDFMIASFGMSGYKQWEAGKNGVFIVLPSGRPNSWRHYRWYTPIKGDHANYGNWSFLRDGAEPSNGVVENWFELLESWCNVVDEPRAASALAETQQELDRLQGEWIMVSQERRGRRSEDEQMKLTIQGDEWTITSAQDLEQPMRMTCNIDLTNDPKTIDLTSKAATQEDVSLGIYKIERDLLTLCLTTGGDVERPKEFTTAAEGSMLIVWKRAKKQ